jgi:hypothetical protein
MTSLLSDQLRQPRNCLSGPYMTGTPPLKAILATGKNWLIGTGKGVACHGNAHQTLSISRP